MILPLQNMEELVVSLLLYMLIYFVWLQRKVPVWLMYDHPLASYEVIDGMATRTEAE